MITGIHHVALIVQDPDAAERYYCSVGGMTRRPSQDAAAVSSGLRVLLAGDDLPLATVLLAGRNGYLELVAPQWPASLSDAIDNPINRPGIRHFCVQNHDCAMLEQAVHNTGGSLIAPPLDLGTGNQYAYARDGEDNIMEIEGLPYAPEGEPTWLGHVAVVTRDMNCAVAFYSALFETPLQNRGKFGPGPQFDRMGGLKDVRIEGAWLQAGNMLLELWQYHAPPCPLDPAPRQIGDPGFSHLCLETDDLDVDRARLVELGGTLLSTCNTNDQIRTIFCSDPDGNVIELLQPLADGRSLAITALADPGICARIEAGRAAERAAS